MSPSDRVSPVLIVTVMVSHTQRFGLIITDSSVILVVSVISLQGSFQIKSVAMVELIAALCHSETTCRIDRSNATMLRP